MNRTLGVDYGLCECGCGGKTAITRVTDRSKGWVKGKPLRFPSGHAVPSRPISGGSAYSYYHLSDLELGWVAGLLEGEEEERLLLYPRRSGGLHGKRRDKSAPQTGTCRRGLRADP